MSIAIDWPTASAIRETVQICCGPLAGRFGRLVSKCDRRWIIELSPGVLVSMAAVNCAPVLMDPDWSTAAEV